MPNPNNMMQELTDQAGPEPDAPDFPVTDEVRKLEKSFKGAMYLLGEIMATFQIEHNQKWFSENMPDNWFDFVDSWIKRYKRIEHE